MPDLPPVAATTSRLAAAVAARNVSARLLRGDGAAALVTLDCGRVLSLSFGEGDENVFWSHPELVAAPAQQRALVGGLGGERLWFGPEIRYFWNGAPDWATFGNYAPPLDADPGHYRWLECSDEAVEMSAHVTLHPTDGDALVGFELRRQIALTPAPLDRASLMSAGITVSHQLAFDDQTQSGVADLWCIMQMPPGSRLVVPLRDGGTGEPLVYTPTAGSWVQRAGHIEWLFTGSQTSKFGLSTRQTTGRAGCLRSLADGRQCLVVRDYDIGPDGSYCDHPYRQPRRDQVFQAWDGFGFGELEAHSPAIDAAVTRTASHETRIWAYAGAAEDVAGIARELLNINLDVLG